MGCFLGGFLRYFLGCFLRYFLGCFLRSFQVELLDKCMRQADWATFYQLTFRLDFDDDDDGDVVVDSDGDDDSFVQGKKENNYDENVKKALILSERF